MMWIRGHKLQHGEVLPYYVQDNIKGLVKEVADKHDAEFKASVHSEACYVKIHGKVISFRNHTGRPSDLDIYLSTFNTWRQCEKYFERRVLRRFLN